MSHVLPQPHTYGMLDAPASLSGPAYQEFPLSSYVVPADARERYEFLGRYIVVGQVSGRTRNLPADSLTLNIALEGDSVGSHTPPGFSSGSSWEPFSLAVIGPTLRLSPTDAGTGLWALETNLSGAGDVEVTLASFLAWYAPLAQ